MYINICIIAYLLTRKQSSELFYFKLFNTMILDLDSIPFFLDKDATDDDYSLFSGEFSSGSSGIMRFEENALVLEFVTARSEYSITSFKQSRSEVQTRIIPLHLIQSIECKRWKIRTKNSNWKHVWNPKIVITTKSLKVLENIPSAQGNELVLTLDLRGLQNARAFAAQVMTLLVENRLQQIEAGTSQSQLLPKP